MSHLEKTLLVIIGFLIVALICSSTVTAIYVSQQNCVGTEK